MTGRILRATAPLWLTAITITDRALGRLLDRAAAGTEPHDCTDEED